MSLREGPHFLSHDWREVDENPYCVILREYDYAHPERTAHWPEEYQHPLACEYVAAITNEDATIQLLEREYDD